MGFTALYKTDFCPDTVVCEDGCLCMHQHIEKETHQNFQKYAPSKLHCGCLSMFRPTLEIDNKEIE